MKIFYFILYHFISLWNDNLQRKGKTQFRSLNLQNQQSSRYSDCMFLFYQFEFQCYTKCWICVNFQYHAFFLRLLLFKFYCRLIWNHFQFHSIWVCLLTVFSQKFDLKKEIYVRAVFKGNFHDVFAGNFYHLLFCSQVFHFFHANYLRHFSSTADWNHHRRELIDL